MGHRSWRRWRAGSTATTGRSACRSIAEHQGYEKYTIGQRKGLGFGSEGRRYVLDIVPATHDVILGDREEHVGTFAPLDDLRVLRNA